MSKTTRIVMSVVIAAIVSVLGCVIAYQTMHSVRFIHDKTYYEVGWDLEGNEVYRKVIDTYDNPGTIAAIYVGLVLLGAMAGLTFDAIIKQIGGYNA